MSTRLTDYTVEVYIAVPAARQDQANTYFKNNIDLVGGENTFRAGLSGDGTAPATWYWCHGSLKLTDLAKLKEVIDSLPNSDVRLVINPTAHGELNDILEKFAHNPPKVRVLENPMTPQEVLDAVNMQVVQSQV